MNASYIIKHLGLTRLPYEGGFYRETYRSSETISHSALPPRYTAEKAFGTAIYYLITTDTFSLLHRLPSDEVFHFYLGDPITMLQLHPDGSCETIILGNNIREGHCLQYAVPKGTWQGLMLIDGGHFALLGTTMAPAFDFLDFEPGKREDLIKMYPDYSHIIERFTVE